MLKILKDVAIRHDGREVRGKAGQIVNVKASFDVSDEVTQGIEVRYTSKFRGFVKRVNIDKSKTVTLATQPIHNDVEQKIRKEDEEVVSVEEEPVEEEKQEAVEETTESASTPGKKGKGRKKK